jgi:hypothetical protein
VAFEELIVPAAISGGLAGAITFSAWKLFTHYFVPVPPNRALVLFGERPSNSEGARAQRGGGVELRAPRIIVGGGVYLPPWRRGRGFLSLEPIDADVMVRVAAGGRAPADPSWEVRIALQVKIPAEPQMLRTAAENLLGKSEEELRRMVCRTIEGAAPPILAGLPTEAAEVDWERLAAEIQASAARDLVAAGLVIRSLSVTQLQRFDPRPEGAPTPGAPDGPLRAPWPSGDPAVRLGTLEARLDRTERNLGNLGAELVRVVREGSLFSEPPVILPYDSMGGDPPAAAPSDRTSTVPGARAGRSRALLDAKQ